jgi:hypothetical protein
MLDEWINEGQEEFVAQTECLSCTAYDDIVADQHNYGLPDDCLRPYRLDYDGTALEYLTRAEMQAVAYDQSDVTSGTPNYWWANEAAVWIFPVPSSNLSDGIRMGYFYLPATLSDDDDAAEIPARYQRMLSLYAATQALLILGHADRAGDWEQKWARRLVQARAHLRIKQRARYKKRLPGERLRSGQSGIGLARQGMFTRIS